MTKKRHLHATFNDGYKQTHISTYFKVTNNIFCAAEKMKSQQSSTNKETDSEELVLSPQKKRPKPISDESDETESVDAEDSCNSLVAQLAKTSTCGLSPVDPKTPKSLKEDITLPFEIPDYTYSESSDFELLGNDNTVLQPRDRRKIRHGQECLKSNSEAILSMSHRKKNVAIKRDIKRKLKTKPISISGSSDEEETQRKVRKVDKFGGSGRSKSCKKLFQSGANTCINNQEKKNLEDAQAALSGISTSKTTSEIPLRHAIDVNRPTIVSANSKPQTLQETSNCNSYKPSTSADFISTDFSSRVVVDLLSTSVQSSSSNDTIVYEQNINFAVRENISSTPKKIRVLENVVINSPTQFLKQCDLSPIKKGARRNSTVKQNVFSKQSRFMNDTMMRNSTIATEEKINNNNCTIELFKKIIKYIGGHSHLKTMLTRTETEMLHRFLLIPKTNYQIFCFQLYTRIQNWYNIFKLRDELCIKLSGLEMKNMYDYLYENNFVLKDFSTEQCCELLHSLSVKDVKEICDSFKIKLTNEKKSEIVEKLLSIFLSHSILTPKSKEILRDRIKHKMGYCVKLSPELYKLFNKVHLLYSFTTSDYNKPSDLHSFLGKIKNKEIFIPKFNVNMDIEIFLSIPEFSRFAEACEHKQAMVEYHKKNNIVLMLQLSESAHTELKDILNSNVEPKPSYLMRFTAGYKYTKTLSLGAKYLAVHYPEKVQEWLVFLIKKDRYCLKLHGYWYDLLVRVQYDYLKHYEIAANTLMEAFSRQDISKVDLQELNCRAEKIKRSKAHPISKLVHDRISFVQPAPLREIHFNEINAGLAQIGRKGKCLSKEKAEEKQHEKTIGHIVAEHYLNKGYVDKCDAGELLQTIFFILFWDIIYGRAVPNAFILEIQYFPLDLMSKEFYTNRKGAIDRRFMEIRSTWPNDLLKGFICNIWEEHAHEKSFICDVVDEPKQLFDIILCIGRVKLTQILERIVKDFEAYHTGLPKLFLWTVHKKICKFVEFKDKKDKLSAKQEVWLDFLLSVGANVEVCNVHTERSSTPRKLEKIIKGVKKQTAKCFIKS